MAAPTTASSPPTSTEFGVGDDGTFEQQFYLSALSSLLIEASNNRLGNLDVRLLDLLDLQRDLGVQLIEPSNGTPLSELSREDRVAAIGKILGRWPKPAPVQISRLQRRVDFLVQVFGLPDEEAAIIGLVARREVFRRWRRLLETAVRCDNVDYAVAFAAILGLSRETLDVVFDSKGSLGKCGLADLQWTAGSHSPVPHPFVVKFLKSEAVTEAEMTAALLPVLPLPTLDDASFEHQAGDLDRATRLVADALVTGERANILLYGAPGTGKTEFARLIACANGAQPISVGEADDEGDEPSRQERLDHLRLCRRLVNRRGKSVLVIDEAEDLFLAGIEERASKIWLNRLVEAGTGAHIWIVNQPAVLGEPILRRMDMAIRFEVPAAPLRRRLIERIVTAQCADAVGSADEAKSLTESLVEIGAAPAIISTAMRTGVRLGAAPTEIFGIAHGLAQATGRVATGGYLRPQTCFDPSLSRANFDLADLAHRLRTVPDNWSLLLSGPPGTGKSAYAHHLANQMGCDVICKGGADLLGPFVGQTEQAIAAAFADAERQNAILLIDEADTFLADRGRADRNWEVSMTNELLRLLERGRVRFVATTNRADVLDPAFARRFTLHVEFLPLDAGRARALFTETFGSPPPPELDRVEGLTPGDFGQARKRAALLAISDPSEFVTWLQREVDVRDGGKIRVGF